ncbi:MAG: magnesium transporter [Candidatus Lokiarchaeia archaeon]
MAYYTVKKILKESLPVLLVVVTLASIFSGQVLQDNERVLSLFPAFLIAIPAFINMAGDLASVLSARLTTAMYTGLLEPKFHFSQTLNTNYIATLIVGIIGFSFLGAASSFLAGVIFKVSIQYDPILIFIVILVSGLITTAIMFIVGIVVAIFSFRKGWDPDNITTPIVTTIADAIGILVLFFMVTLLIL